MVRLQPRAPILSPAEHGLTQPSTNRLVRLQSELGDG